MRWNILAAMAVGLTVAVVGTSKTPTASADGNAPRVCSNRTLRGDYGFAIEGTIVPPIPVPSILIRGVALTRFDGHGNLSQVDFVTDNGVPSGSDWIPATGSYELNADCTGTAELNFTNGRPTLHLRMVVVDDGRQIFNTVEGAATNAVGIKVR